MGNVSLMPRKRQSKGDAALFLLTVRAKVPGMAGVRGYICRLTRLRQSLISRRAAGSSCSRPYLTSAPETSPPAARVQGPAAREPARSACKGESARLVSRPAASRSSSTCPAAAFLARISLHEHEIAVAAPGAHFFTVSHDPGEICSIARCASPKSMLDMPR